MYERINWLDHVADPADRYNINKQEDGTYTITLAGTVMQEGTPQDQAHFNLMDAAIWDICAAFGMLLNAVRQQSWALEEDVAPIDNSWQVLTGMVELTNSGAYPYNNSKKSVSLSNNMGSTSYLVMTEVVSSVGPVGDIEVSDKLINGFKLNYNGSATGASVKYIAIGGTKK